MFYFAMQWQFSVSKFDWFVSLRKFVKKNIHFSLNCWSIAFISVYYCNLVVIYQLVLFFFCSIQFKEYWLIWWYIFYIDDHPLEHLFDQIHPTDHKQNQLKHHHRNLITVQWYQLMICLNYSSVSTVSIGIFLNKLTIILFFFK